VVFEGEAGDMESTRTRKVTLPVQGMDCAECTKHVKVALEGVPGVLQATVLLAAEKAIVDLNKEIDIHDLTLAVEIAGYSVPGLHEPDAKRSEPGIPQLLGSFFLICGLVIFIVVIGEWLGWFQLISERLPIGVYVALLAMGGFPVFKNVFLALSQRQITSHTLMTIGVIAAAIVGEWATAVVIVLFMRIGDWVERQTANGARKAIHALVERAPTVAQVERDGVEFELPVDQIQAGDILICRPGDTLAADGEILEGNASVDASSITGESLPVDVALGSSVYAGSIVLAGGFRFRAERVGEETTMGRVIQLVEEAEANKGRIQRFADRFSSYYLPVVLAIAALTYILRQDALAAVSVLVVVCSCAIALATPIAMLASIGAAGKQGLLIKGGRYLEILPKVDRILIDKTGTLTLGAPRVTEIIPLAHLSERDLLIFAAGVERFSEHPIGKAIRQFSLSQGIRIPESQAFHPSPGLGAQAQINGHVIRVGNQSFLSIPEHASALALQRKGKTVVYIEVDDLLVGLIGLADELRTDVPLALRTLRSQGYEHIELLTGDHQAATEPVADILGIGYRAGLLPEDKIEVVREYQAQGYTVAMIGDGINDAPALAQADVGIAIGTVGTDIAIHAADIALMREDWSAIPSIFALSKRTMGVVRLNLVFTVIYNLVGMALAAMGFLPPALAAAAQSLPDVGILANSSRLLRLEKSSETRVV
jgi:Cu+-exporting ATPase